MSLVHPILAFASSLLDQLAEVAHRRLAVEVVRNQMKVAEVESHLTAEAGEEENRRQMVVEAAVVCPRRSPCYQYCREWLIVIEGDWNRKLEVEISRCD